jgi:anaerobic selenocysteine-containing dehydrogenase
MPNPTAELHPDTAADYGISHGDWIVIETPRGRARAQAEVTTSIVAGVRLRQPRLVGGLRGARHRPLDPFDPFDERGANLNLLVLTDLRDPISGGTPHRSSLCRVSRAEPTTP